jgi:hypothetical protein
MANGVKLRIVGCFRSVARSGQESIAQGLPWVMPSTELALKGRSGTARIGSETFEPDRVRISGPFRASAFIGLPRVNPGLCFLGYFGPQRKPWAMFAWPFRATEQALGYAFLATTG